MQITRRSALLSPFALSLAALPASAQGVIAGLPRRETLILENPEGTIRNAGWFNIWAINAGGQSTGLHQLTMDTLWYIDPERGIDGHAWDNSLAAAPPEYNADFTEMKVRLRDGIVWSDGTPFTSADVVHTVETQIANRGMRWSAVLAQNVAQVTAPNAHSVTFTLKKPNSRFHAQFTTRWGAIWIMPKHVFEKVQDPVRFDFANPVTLGAYTLHSFDPNGKWYIWQRREDWQRTTLGRFGMPGPRYVAYVDPGPPDKRVIAQMNHDLDVVHDVAPEGMFTLARQSQTSKGWFPRFPYAHPDPTLPSLIFNNQNPLFQSRDVRWALALLIDIKAVSMASYRGAATISAIAVPPTGTHPADYHAPLESWVEAFEIDTGKRKFRPYDPAMGKQITDMLRPTLKDQIPTDPEQIAKSFGMGWWKPNAQAAAELLERAGFRKQGSAWHTPDGKPFSIRVMVEGESRPVMTRAGTMIAQNWRQFGIDAKVDVAQGTLVDRRAAGDFDTFIGWSVETYGGHPDLAYFLDSWHSQFVAKAGSPQPLRNWQRWANPELDRIIEQIRTIGFDDPRSLELGRDYVKLMVREMPIIPLMAYNVFTTVDEQYWTGYPNAEDPYTNPVTNWGNSRYMFPRLKSRA
ncbi:ABC transporter substrate-binding protein [Paracraurococcus lichenis]|uniref:ABC transporter substrate-binding protein n=1 Tax=Paracraurococcus lichenis TaxID=3064888 RepID=A0ABT9E942_9PROT|nr:ABC transporter substrate-binding protein [Paracraurococcus sp. LOR1-02]MDO9712708.1 ABC transporter substrate-binding protein [Paracraurococcus sp. LOR1-02]